MAFKLLSGTHNKKCFISLFSKHIHMVTEIKVSENISLPLILWYFMVFYFLFSSINISFFFNYSWNNWLQYLVFTHYPKKDVITTLKAFTVKCLVSAHTINKFPFHDIFSAMFFALLCFLVLVIPLLKMSRQHSAEVLSSISKCKEGVMCLTGKIHVLHKLRSDMTSTIYIK